MFEVCTHAIARPLIKVWLNTSPHSWRRSVIANDSPHVHAPGTNPDRILLTGDGAATGRGVITHDLGLPGYLARSLTAHTGHATDVDIVVTRDMTAATCLTSLAGMNLDQYDIVVLSLGANEALALTSPTTWTYALGKILSQLEQHTPTATTFFVLPIPFFGINPYLPKTLARVVDAHVQHLNAQTQEIVSHKPQVTLIPVAQVNAYEPESAHVYHRWAEAIALRISDSLDPERPPATDTTKVNEQARQRALTDLDIIDTDTDPFLDRLTERARQVFGTRIAAVTLIESDIQVMKSASGIEPVELPREEAFCDITIRRAAHFVIEDTRLDSRYADYSVVKGDPGIRFYAGYPIESQNGQRVGALCIMDTEPRQFTQEDATMLRNLAQETQAHLWRASAEPSSQPPRPNKSSE
jgi:GAF domain-containing protein